jgi:hypothetical protein
MPASLLAMTAMLFTLITILLFALMVTIRNPIQLVPMKNQPK